jgi:hypothetical protein
VRPLYLAKARAAHLRLDERRIFVVGRARDTDRGAVALHVHSGLVGRAALPDAVATRPALAG